MAKFTTNYNVHQLGSMIDREVLAEMNHIAKQIGKPEIHHGDYKPSALRKRLAQLLPNNN